MVEIFGELGPSFKTDLTATARGRGSRPHGLRATHPPHLRASAVPPSRHRLCWPRVYVDAERGLGGALSGGVLDGATTAVGRHGGRGGGLSARHRGADKCAGNHPIGPGGDSPSPGGEGPGHVHRPTPRDLHAAIPAGLRPGRHRHPVHQGTLSVGGVPHLSQRLRRLHRSEGPRLRPRRLLRSPQQRGSRPRRRALSAPRASRCLAWARCACPRGPRIRDRLAPGRAILGRCRRPPARSNPPLSRSPDE
jgi:hypothetical protein